MFDYRLKFLKNKSLTNLLSYGKRKFEGNLEKYQSDLNRLDQELNRTFIPDKNNKTLRILIGPSFSIYPPCFVHDRILSYALRLRGAEIIPIYCDGIQSVECNVFGGVWKGNDFSTSCTFCQKRSEQLWEENPIAPIKLSNYILSKDFDEINEKINDLEDEQWVTYTENGFDYGPWAKDILVNNYVVGDFHLIKNYNKLGITHLRNLLFLHKAYKRILIEMKPDRVITNDSYYGMWAILQHLCKKKNIPFYSHWIGGRQNAWCYAFNDSAMNLDFSPAWENFSKIPLNNRQINKVKNWLDGRNEGKEMILDTASVSSCCGDEFDIDTLNPDKPITLLASNVIWDLAALNKQIIFNDMIDWIAHTIQWFADNQDYQLIVKSHPAELNPLIPKTQERIIPALEDRGIYIPKNVFILSPNVNISVYQLFPISNLGIVHTSSVGFEMAAHELPVITTGKSPYRGFGFTFDPNTSDGYFQTIQDILTNKVTYDLRKQLDLVYKFILFYHFHYYSKIDIIDYSWGETPRIKIRSINEIQPNKNPYLDYFVDSIMNGLPIISENRWPPES